MNIQPWSSAITEPQAAKDPIDQVEKTDQRIVHLFGEWIQEGITLVN